MAFQTAQQMVNAGSVPFAATCRWYLSPVQLASDGQAGDKARFPKFTNCRAHGVSPRVRDPPDCQSIVALADAIKPRRFSTLATVVRCQLPPRAIGIRLRFNSSASAHWETKPVAISSGMVEARAAARESAPRLFAKAAASIPLGRDEVTVLTGSIGPLLPEFI